MTYASKTRFNNVQHFLLKKKEKKKEKTARDVAAFWMSRKQTQHFWVWLRYSTSCNGIISPSAHIIVQLGWMATLTSRQDDWAQSVEHLTAERYKVAGSIPWTYTHQWTLKWRYCLCSAANGRTFAWLRWPRKMAVRSPVGNVKIVSSISTFLLNWYRLPEKCVF